MKASTIITIVALTIADINAAAARYSGFELTCKWINYNNLIGGLGDNRSMISEAFCDRSPGLGDLQVTGLDLKTCLGWDIHTCNFVTPPGTADAFTFSCGACSIGTGSRDGGYEIHPPLDCDCLCFENSFSKGSISSSSHLGNINGTVGGDGVSAGL